MGFSEFEVKRFEKLLQAFCDRHGPGPEIRAKLRWEFRIDGRSVELLETRPVWNDPSQTLSTGFAKATYVMSRRDWKVSWLRADLKWHGYGPCPRVKTLEEFLALVDADEECCFKG